MITGTRRIGKYAEQYEQVLIARGSSAKHSQVSGARLRRILEMMGVKTLGQLSPVKADLAIGSLAQTISNATCNHYLKVLRAFVRWLMQNQLIAINPLLGVRGLNGNLNRRHERRALSDDEIYRLLTITGRQRRYGKMSGPDRSLLYEVAANSGFRSNEIRKLRGRDLHLDDANPSIQLAGDFTKNKKPASQPIPVELAKRLRRFISGRDADSPLFRLPHPSNVVVMFRGDLEAASIEYRDAHNRFADFHSLRHTYITRLPRIIPNLRLVQDLARHSKITTTMGYAHVNPTERVAAIQQFGIWATPVIA